jgi:hypothetical protein
VYIVGPYLFTGDELDGYLKNRQAEAVEAARSERSAGNAGSGADIVRAIYDRFSIPDTGMHVDKAFFVDERPLTDEEGEAIAVRDEDKDTYKAVTIAVPYSGDSHLFTCTPTIYSANQPQAEVKDDALYITWFLAEVEEYQLENNFKRTIALIERTLEVTQWQAMAFNQEMMEALKAEVMGGAAAG